MGWSYRKSFKLGPVRINLSKSGIGYSAGVKGLRVGVNASGKTYTSVSVPGTGLRYIETKGSLDDDGLGYRVIGCLFAFCLLIALAGGLLIARLRSLPIPIESQERSRPLLSQPESEATSEPARSVSTTRVAEQAIPSPAPIVPEQPIVPAPVVVDRPDEPVRMPAINPGTLPGNDAERIAAARLKTAKTFLRTSPKAGRKVLEDLVRKYPDTASATEARTILAELTAN